MELCAKAAGFVLGHGASPTTNRGIPKFRKIPSRFQPKNRSRQLLKSNRTGLISQFLGGTLALSFLLSRGCASGGRTPWSATARSEVSLCNKYNRLGQLLWKLWLPHLGRTKSCRFGDVRMEPFSVAAFGRVLWFNAKASELWGRSPRIGDDSELYCGS